MSTRANSEGPFDLVSHARRGPGRRDHLSPGQIAQVARTVRRAPEVMVKVLSRGGQDLKAVSRHFDYLRQREDGEREIETDDGRRLAGQGVTKELLEDWDLDLEQHRRRSELDARGGGSAKLVHKLVFSMPAGTPPLKVLDAVKNFAQEEFSFKHRYAMVLHTDEPHPHVHMILKAVSEQGERLHIRKATLREWRRGFAEHLRELGVEANATERAVRGQSKVPKNDGIYRATLRGDSTHTRSRLEAVAAAVREGRLPYERGKSKLMETRRQVECGWRATSDLLIHQGQPELAARVTRFIDEMYPPLTDNERLAVEHFHHARERSYAR